MPFTYLGLPMGTTKPKFENLTPMIDRVERRLSACSTWLSYLGRLEMVNSANTPITTYAMCTIKLPKGVIDVTESTNYTKLSKKIHLQEQTI
jgi:hypothetical protein